MDLPQMIANFLVLFLGGVLIVPAAVVWLRHREHSASQVICGALIVVASLFGFGPWMHVDFGLGRDGARLRLDRIEQRIEQVSDVQRVQSLRADVDLAAQRALFDSQSGRLELGTQQPSRYFNLVEKVKTLEKNIIEKGSISPWSYGENISSDIKSEYLKLRQEFETLEAK
ncbi:hypothetical protein [Oceanibacterium hippocampi]|uniref:hypothetical protein n=1 Tax=Oceanibacterium hippocampi TaxID=745714 RepID=UPI00111BFC4B|nr:hypothetical protein [Oceanibacterium hippocampi]